MKKQWEKNTLSNEGGIELIKDELKLYTIAEVTKILKVTQRTVYNFITNGDLKAIKVGRYWRVKHNDLEEYLAARTRR